MLLSLSSPPYAAISVLVALQAASASPSAPHAPLLTPALSTRLASLSHPIPILFLFLFLSCFFLFVVVVFFFFNLPLILSLSSRDADASKRLHPSRQLVPADMPSSKLPSPVSEGAHLHYFSFIFFSSLVFSCWQQTNDFFVVRFYCHAYTHTLFFVVLYFYSRASFLPPLRRLLGSTTSRRAN